MFRVYFERYRHSHRSYATVDIAMSARGNNHFVFHGGIKTFKARLLVALGASDVILERRHKHGWCSSIGLKDSSFELHH